MDHAVGSRRDRGLSQRRKPRRQSLGMAACAKLRDIMRGALNAALKQRQFDRR
jgi:hypothetical protein